MTFFQIEILFLLWTVPVIWLIYFYGMKKRRSIMSRFAANRGLQAIVPATGRNRRLVKATMTLLIVLLAIVALAGPKYGYRWQEIEQKGIDIIVALDCSKSMLATDIEPSRLDRAKREVYDLLTMLRGDRVGLVAFAGTAFLQCPLTIDYDAFNLFLKALTPDFLPVGGTDLTTAVTIALESFDAKSSAERAIILITDGENTGKGNPLQAAAQAGELGVKLFCIGVGKDDGVPLPQPEGGFKKDASGKIVLSRLDEETLKKMAVTTGGTYARSVAGDMDLDAIYMEQIRGKMEASAITGGRKQIFENRFQWPLAVAVVIFMVMLFIATVPPKGLVVIIMLLLIGLAPTARAEPLEEGLDAYAQGEYEAALKLLIDAQLQNPDRPALVYNIGNAYYKTGDFDSAYHHFNQVLESDDPDLKHNTRYNLGNTSFRRGDLEEAIQHYEAALKIEPNDEQARQNIEFVKQVMQQQQTQNTPQDGDSQQDDSQNDAQSQQAHASSEQNQDQEQQSETGQSNQDQGDTPTPQQGQAKSEDEPSGRQDVNPGSENHQDQGQAQADASSTEQAPQKNQQAEKMLNRLKDQPGKAAIPFYQKRTVERDW